jgi:rubrerythrin
MNTDQLNELLYQALETEQGGIQVYETALRCVVNEELQELMCHAARREIRGEAGPT